ncbi:MAG: phospho-N-acetylmuramoyl-pentapeptide-transferase [Clostridia bacterium]|nr:phospho-N-acetylmuramoyl-pentapeptide-transferase [Clostridia bacterium]
MSWIISLVISFVITAVVTPLLIPFLKKLKFGQMILEDGPTWHAKKQGTPTMGGLGFILAMTVASLIVSQSVETLFVVIVGLLFGVVGFVDDYIKVVKKRNKGFSASAKFICQSVVALGASVFMYVMNSHTVKIPFVEGSFDFGILYVVFVMFVMLATVNSVNLTDGVDGLTSSVSVACALFFLFAAIKLEFAGVAVALAAMIGGVLGFLLYNFFPAKVFMGDTGSLYLGGILSAAAVMMGLEFSLIIAGFVFLSETLSVIVQVTSFKLTGKRVFKMSPLHHHFEMCGWKETKIVGVFTLVTLVLSAICYIGLK